MFAYNMYGHHCGNLEVMLKRGGREYRQWSQNGEQGLSWRNAEVFLEELRGDEEVQILSPINNRHIGNNMVYMNV